MATLIVYGPDNRTATKLVASVFDRPGQAEPVAVEKWLMQGGDIRQDPGMKEALQGFLKRHRVVKSLAHDVIFGCPHEEGIDYPEGEVCPHCLFWANLDRHTLEPKSPEVSLTAEQILTCLSRERTEQPLVTLAATDRHRDIMVEPFLQAVEIGLARAAAVTPEEADLFTYGVAFLAKWREPRAYPLFIRWLSLPGQGAFEIGGDTVTEWGPRLLASVCGGDLGPIKQLILNREADEFCRSMAVESLAVLAAWGEISREEVADYYLWLVREGLEREPGAVWDGVFNSSHSIEAAQVFAELERAEADELVDPTMDFAEALEEMKKSRPGWEFGLYQDGNPRFDDVAKETSWWACFSKSGFESRPKDDYWDKAWAAELAKLAKHEEAGPPVISVPYVASAKPGRNDPCSCGSGKKYKKCCGK